MIDIFRKALVIGSLLPFAWMAAPAAHADQRAKDAFLGQKCVKCHSIESQGVKADEKAVAKGKKIHDLSTVGDRHDAAWIKQWLKREIAWSSDPNKKARKHKKKWKGTDEDLDAVANWLASLKSESGK